jgi:hypothetical protein
MVYQVVWLIVVVVATSDGHDSKRGELQRTDREMIPCNPHGSRPEE